MMVFTRLTPCPDPIRGLLHAGNRRNVRSWHPPAGRGHGPPPIPRRTHEAAGARAPRPDPPERGRHSAMNSRVIARNRGFSSASHRSSDQATNRRTRNRDTSEAHPRRHARRSARSAVHSTNSYSSPSKYRIRSRHSSSSPRTSAPEARARHRPARGTDTTPRARGQRRNRISTPVRFGRRRGTLPSTAARTSSSRIVP